jgi:hypothetical protein
MSSARAVWISFSLVVVYGGIIFGAFVLVFLSFVLIVFDSTTVFGVAALLLCVGA